MEWSDVAMPLLPAQASRDGLDRYEATFGLQARSL